MKIHPPSSPVVRSRPGGFTLIELLTVIAIIGILAAIIVPVVGRVRSSAKSAACLSNLRQVGSALQVYAHDNRNRFPFGYRADTNTYWHHELAAYAGSVAPSAGKAVSSNVFFCASEEIQPTEDYLKRTNYIANPRMLPERKNDSTARISFQQVQRPSQTIFASDGTVHQYGAADWGFFSQTGYSKSSPSLAETVVPNQTDAGKARISWRHDRKTQVVFVDGHASSFAEGQLLYKHLEPSY